MSARFPISIFLFFLIFSPLAGGAGLALAPEEIRRVQAQIAARGTGERIAFWAEKFVGTPYDQDPQGIYVTRAAIVVDETVDCMYLTFRAVELALSRSPEEAVEIALDRRFHTRGILRDERVANYQDRFEYGEEMIESGKWGEEITSRLGPAVRIEGSRGSSFYEILPQQDLLAAEKKLKDGDILFFIKSPEKRLAGEAVAHIGIVKKERGRQGKEYFLIHASGTKKKGGVVKKVLLREYLTKMAFIGAKVTRFP